MYKKIKVQPLAGALGAEIFGIDLSTEIDPATLAEVRQAHLEYLVIFFREQNVSDLDLARFARNFGKLAMLPPHRQVPGNFPELLVIDKKPELSLIHI